MKTFPSSGNSNLAESETTVPPTSQTLAMARNSYARVIPASKRLLWRELRNTKVSAKPVWGKSLPKAIPVINTTVDT